MKYTLKQVLEEFLKEDSDRKKWGMPLFKLACPITHKTITQFQKDWDGSKSFEEFVVEQNKVIKECFEKEVSDVGADIRKTLGLEPITLETRIEV